MCSYIHLFLLLFARVLLLHFSVGLEGPMCMPAYRIADDVFPQMNFVLQVKFHDGEVYLWHKVSPSFLYGHCIWTSHMAPHVKAVPKRVDSDRQLLCLQVQTTINNLIVGKIYIQHTGTYTVKNVDTGLTAVMELVKPKLMTLSTKSRNEHLVRIHADFQPSLPI